MLAFLTRQALTGSCQSQTQRKFSVFCTKFPHQQFDKWQMHFSQFLMWCIRQHDMILFDRLIAKAKESFHLRNIYVSFRSIFFSIFQLTERGKEPLKGLDDLWRLLATGNSLIPNVRTQKQTAIAWYPRHYEGNAIWDSFQGGKWHYGNNKKASFHSHNHLLDVGSAGASQNPFVSHFGAMRRMEELSSFLSFIFPRDYDSLLSWKTNVRSVSKRFFSVLNILWCIITAYYSHYQMDGSRFQTQLFPSSSSYASTNNKIH